MKNLSTWLLVCFMIMYWIYRIVVAITFSFGIDFIVIPIDMTSEIVLLFITILCVALITRRNMLGALIYLITYGWYFGTDLFHNIMGIIDGAVDINTFTITMSSFIGIILPLAVLFDLLLDKNRKAHPTDKKTDWFYKNKDYDREADERADKNNYRTL